MKIIKGLTFALGMLVSAVSIGMGAMSESEIKQNANNCLIDNNKKACQTLIDGANLCSVEQCDIDICSCNNIGLTYDDAGYINLAIPYYEKAIKLGDYVSYNNLGLIYENQNKIVEAKKY